MKTILIIPMLLLSCREQERSPARTALEELEKERFVDSAVKALVNKPAFDTLSVLPCPVKISNARLPQQEYSNYKNISFTYQNVSGKSIAAIRFKWYGSNAFNEPADMGSSYETGFGGGFDDDPLAQGRKRNVCFSILSKDAKKVEKIWVTEIAFKDGTKWKSGKDPL